MPTDVNGVFIQLRTLLASEIDPFMAVLKDEPDAYHIYAKGEFVFGKRKMTDVFFAGIEKNKADVTLHFLPVYMNEGLKESLQPVFLSKLKGKACFHFKSLDPETEAAIKDAFGKGRASWGVGPRG